MKALKSRMQKVFRTVKKLSHNHELGSEILRKLGGDSQGETFESEAEVLMALAALLSDLAKKAGAEGRASDKVRLYGLKVKAQIMALAVYPSHIEIFDVVGGRAPLIGISLKGKNYSWGSHIFVADIPVELHPVMDGLLKEYFSR